MNNTQDNQDGPNGWTSPTANCCAYFVCSSGGEPDCIRFSEAEAKRSDSEYIDGFDCNGEKAKGQQWKSVGSGWTNDF
jgi:hypothetical protein